MLKLEDLEKDAQIRNLEGNKIVRIVSIEPVGNDAANVFYVDPDGKPGTQMLFRSCFDEGFMHSTTWIALTCVLLKLIR